MKYNITSPKQRVAKAGHRTLRLLIPGSVLEIVVELCIAVTSNPQESSIVVCIIERCSGTGPIGFVGLSVFHLVRSRISPDNRTLVPCSLCCSGNASRELRYHRANDTSRQPNPRRHGDGNRWRTLSLWLVRKRF